MFDASRLIHRVHKNVLQSADPVVAILWNRRYTETRDYFFSWKFSH